MQISNSFFVGVLCHVMTSLTSLLQEFLLKHWRSQCYEIDRRSMNNRKKEKLQTDEDSMCSFESRWKHKKEMQAETVVSVFFCIAGKFIF